MTGAGFNGASIALFIVILCGVFVLANVLAWALFRLRPDLLLSENERLRLDLFARYDGELARHRAEWYGIKPEEWSDFVTESLEFGAKTNVHEAFTGLKLEAWSGRYYNISPHGFRSVENQGPWPPSKDAFNIFFFGGSTALHQGPDWAGIPNHLQRCCDGRTERPVRLYNFGRSAYFSSQEFILFSRLLAEGARPDMAIFLDGLNDFFFYDGNPSSYGVFKHLFAQAQERQWREYYRRFGATPRWDALQDFFAGLPLIRGVDALATRITDADAPSEGPSYRADENLSRQAYEKVIDRYLNNKAQAESIAALYGVRTVFVWQPVPGYGYDLSHHAALQPHFGLGGHARSGLGYPLMAERLKSAPADPGFIWLAEMTRGMDKPLFLDNVHYTAEFSRMIGERIGDELLTRGLLPSRKEP